MERNINVIDDLDGGKIVVINDIAFKGRQKIEWPDVEKYLKEFVGEYYSIIETSDMIYIGSDLPDEFTGSNYTKKLKGALAKAKANAAQGLPELIEIASKKRFKENLKEKHDSDAKYGWYRYDTKFALPVYNENQELERLNVFQAVLLIRHAQDGKLYLYDLVNIKKKRVSRLSNKLYGKKLASSFYYSIRSLKICQYEISKFSIEFHSKETCKMADSTMSFYKSSMVLQ